MIPLEAVRTAVLSDVPWTRLDELVRAEMAAGRKVKEIADDLIRMADEVWDTPGLSEDGHDAFGDTLDALTGNCHRDSCYYDPPRTDLPTREEIARLPRWARVAFAARCARRAFPLYAALWSASPPDVVRTLGLMVEACELAASRRSVTIKTTPLPDEPSLDDEPQQSGFVRESVNAAYSAAFWQTLEAGLGADRSTGSDVDEVVRSLRLAHSAIVAIDTYCSASIRNDYDHLVAVANWQHWFDETPVPPDIFGPLWPDGPPPSWPADPDLPPRTDLPLELMSAARVLEQMTEDDAVRVFNAINAYYIARTGDRLTLEDLRPLIAAGVRAEV